MASSIFGNNNPQNSIFSRLNQVQNLINGNPQQVYDNLMKNNPQFADFVNKNQGKTPEQIARENGLDFNTIKSLLG